jgi:peptide/nickel transport system permease protein
MRHAAGAGCAVPAADGGSMGRYIARRLVTAIPILIGISVVLFVILHLSPGDPLSIYAANPNVTPEVKAQIVHHYGLDQPLAVQYLRWAEGLFTGDWGQSFFENRPVTQVVLDRLPVTLRVMGTAFLLSLLVAFPIGILSAVKQYSLLDHVLTTVSFVGLSVPPFFSRLVLIIVFGVKLKWLPFVYTSQVPATGWHGAVVQVKQLILPLMVLGLYQVGVMTRYIRAAMLEVLHLDYMRTGRAKGLPEGTLLLRHGLRNALLPVVTLIALYVPAIFTGAIITEQIFAIPGIGRLLINSIQNNDYLVVMAIVFIYAVLTVLCNLAADVAYALLDPRITYR